MFNISIKNSFTLSFDSCSTVKKTVDTRLEYQVDIGSAQNINSPIYLVKTHQTADRIGVPNKAKSVAVFDNLNVRKYHVDIDGVGYPRDSVNIDYATKDYLDQKRDLKLFQKEFVVEELLYPFVSYTDMKTKYPIQVTDLRFQVDHNNPIKIHLFEECRGATNNARLFLILIRHREIKLISDGNRVTEVIII